MCGAVASTSAVAALARYPRIAGAAFVVIALAVAAGGLVSFWLIADLDRGDYVRFA